MRMFRDKGIDDMIRLRTFVFVGCAIATQAALFAQTPKPADVRHRARELGKTYYPSLSAMVAAKKGGD